jgi:hypothetical protein
MPCDGHLTSQQARFLKTKKHSFEEPETFFMLSFRYPGMGEESYNKDKG